MLLRFSPRATNERASTGHASEETLRTLKVGGEQVKTASVDLTECLARLAVATEETAHTAHSMSAATGTVADEAQSVASATEEMTAAMREVSQAAAQATVAVTDASRAAHEVRGSVESLTESTGQIDGVVKSVSSISDQTRLLALNATIEAARAGEAGKGFAVVAEEVKNLADETTSATTEIADKLAQLAEHSEAVREAVLRIDQMLQQVERNQASIAAAIEEQNTTIAEITRSAANVAGATSSLRADVVSCVDTTESSHASLERAREQMTRMEHAVEAQQVTIDRIADGIVLHPLRAGISAHAAWKKRLRTAIDTGSLPAGVTVQSASRDDVCPFGKWLHSGQADALDRTRAAETREAHARFHQAAGQILAEAAAGRRREADALMCDTDGYAGIAMRLTDDLTAWAAEVETHH
ncbi:methyl-accepting chemotaxis protein [Austwickia chelonae]|uniref:methyl-accepting chemotaxis protein n=1 Tax=Austwickia chelonae TaxID=100225 RepID=UPI000E229BB5|nr:methyl-accepting chemotaxis protein [Austwickia chelonae]